MNNNKNEKKELPFVILAVVVLVTVCFGYIGNAIISHIHNLILDRNIWIIIAGISFIAGTFLHIKGIKRV